MKGVVGSPGKKIPITPNISDTPPAMPYAALARRDGGPLLTDVLGSVGMEKIEGRVELLAD